MPVPGVTEAKADQSDNPQERRDRYREKNRGAAQKCRERKAERNKLLQRNVNYYSVANTSLYNENLRLREEVTNLKMVLASHRECPIARRMAWVQQQRQQHQQPPQQLEQQQQLQLEYQPQEQQHQHQNQQ